MSTNYMFMWYMELHFLHMLTALTRCALNNMYIPTACDAIVVWRFVGCNLVTLVIPAIA